MIVRIGAKYDIQEDGSKPNTASGVPSVAKKQLRSSLIARTAVQA